MAYNILSTSNIMALHTGEISEINPELGFYRMILYRLGVVPDVSPYLPVMDSIMCNDELSFVSKYHKVRVAFNERFACKLVSLAVRERELFLVADPKVLSEESAEEPAPKSVAYGESVDDDPDMFAAMCTAQPDLFLGMEMEE